MRRRATPLFLERDSYRRRRLMDAARLLPVVGAILFLLPLLWAPQNSPAPDTARGGIYLFAVWAALIGAAFLLSRRLPDEAPPPASPPAASLPPSPPAASLSSSLPAPPPARETPP